MSVDDQITKPKNLLVAALDTEDGDAAVTAIRMRSASLMMT